MIVLTFANEVDFSHIVKFTVDSMTLPKLDRAQVLQEIRHESGIWQVLKRVELVLVFGFPLPEFEKSFELMHEVLVKEFLFDTELDFNWQLLKHLDMLFFP